MSLDKTLSEDGKDLTIRIEDKFDFTKVQDFRLAYSEPPEGITTLIIDLEKTNYMDSSALGMLLNMHRNLHHKVKTFRIVKCRPQVLKILQIARFDKKFDMS